MRLPAEVSSRTVPGQTLRGLPVGRSRCTDTASGAMIASARAPSGSGSAMTSRPPSARARASPVTVPGQALRPSIRATQGERGCRVTSAGGASWRARPSSRTRTRSARETASTGSCVTIRQTPPNSARWLRRVCRTRARVVWSSAASGSSSSSNRGRAANARARATRCACPPESWAGLRCARWPTPSRSSHCCAVRRASPRGVPWARSP